MEKTLSRPPLTLGIAVDSKAAKAAKPKGGTNMRVIKFRGWSEHHKKWHDRVLAGCTSDGADYICNLVWSDDHGEYGDWVNFDGPIVQYTGLKDDRGKPIYEGDVVEHVLARWLGEVRFADGSYIVQGRNGKWDLSVPRAERLEVIGNIYEHAHLLAPKGIDSTAQPSGAEADQGVSNLEPL